MLVYSYVVFVCPRVGEAGREEAGSVCITSETPSLDLLD